MTSGPGVAATAYGAAGAVSAGHPLAVQAGVALLGRGGSAVDAAIGAQAVICVVMPQAAGLGGDMLSLVHDSGRAFAVNGTGLSPARLAADPAISGGSSVTVPGLVDGWLTAHRRWGRLALDVVLDQAITHAEHGVEPDPPLLSAARSQRRRLVDGGAHEWSLLHLLDRPGQSWRQPQLAALLTRVAQSGREAFYAGAAGEAIAAATRRHGGALRVDDLENHETPTPDPLAVRWGSGQVYVQPPASQGVLLAMALNRVTELAATGVHVGDHVLVEVTEAAFQHRSECLLGRSLLEVALPVNLDRASGRGGPRAYLHTAGVAAVDADGQVVSSLVSVFDDFGSGVYVPELGIVLNNRAAGFTDGANAAAPSKRPVHTLAPAIVDDSAGNVIGMATPGADGQVQTLLQVLTAEEATLAEAVTRPRWRSENGALLIEDGHPGAAELAARGHRVELRPPGSEVFGAVVAAGTAGPDLFAIADWRRQTDAGAAE